MKNNSIFLILLFFINLSFSQEQKVLDSLLILYPTVENDTLKVNLLNSIAWQYRNSDLKKVDSITHKALILALKIGYKNGQVRSYFNIGNMYYIQGDFPNTLTNYTKAAEILEQLDDKEGIANALMGIGNVHAIQKDYESAIEYQTKALQLRLEINDSLGIAGSYNNLGSIYMDLKDYEKALDYLIKSMQIKEALEYWKGLSSSYGNIGLIYKELDNLDEALNYQIKALEIRQKINNLKGMSMSYNDIGNIYLEKKQFSQALENQEKSLQIAQEINFGQGILGALQSLYITYEIKGDYQKALEIYKEHEAYSDSLYNLEKSKEIKKIEEQYEGEKKDRKIESLNQNKKMMEIKAQKDWIIKAILSSSIIVFLILIVFLIRSILQKKRANTVITQQKQLVVAINEELNQVNEEIIAQRDEIERQKMEVERRSGEITDSITYAKRIQAAILPSQQTVNEHLPDSFIIYKPKDIVAGDFYWIHPTPTHPIGKKASSPLSKTEDGVLFAVADCTGHGVPGAMVSVVCNNALNRAIREFNLTNPSEILEKTTELVTFEFEKSEEEVKDGMDIALCSIQFPTPLEGHRMGSLQYAGANNPLWLVRNQSNSENDYKIIEYKPDRQPVGKYDNHESFTNHEIEIQKGDIIYIFTDGYLDQFGGEQNKKLGHKKFREILVAIAHLPMNQQKIELENHYDIWKGEEEQVDDICIIGVKF